MLPRCRSFRKVLWVGLASNVLVFQAGGCTFAREDAIGIVADTLALAVTIAAESLLIGILGG
jgi:hypothetical protein